MATQEELEVYKAKLTKAAADPTLSVWFDDFRKQNRPISEIQLQLSWVDRELAKLAETPVRRRMLLKSCSGL